MTKKGILKRSEEQNIRIQRTTKSLVKTWTKKNLQMNYNDWDDLKILKITPSNHEEADLVFLKCQNRDETAKLTSRAKYLPQNLGENNPIFVP